MDDRALEMTIRNSSIGKLPERLPPESPRRRVLEWILALLG
jgi:hypothetical protein